MRRTTLGGMGGSSTNTRALSLAGPPSRRMSEMPGKRATMGGRKSSIRRKSSLGRQSTGTERRIKTDPRPIKDKKFMAESIKKVIVYLTQSGYDNQISPKILHSPTQKDFMNIFIFLVSQFDPNNPGLRPPSKKGGAAPSIPDYVVREMKRLQYPFTISKSALQSIGSPHTWPHLLAVLSWMVELLQYEMRKDEAGNEFEAEDNGMNKFFFEHVVGAYEGFLSAPDCEDEDEAEALEQARVEAEDQELMEQFQLRDGDTQAEVEQLQEQMASLQAEIEVLSNDQSEFEEQVQKRDDMRGDVVRFEKLIEQLEQHKEMMTEKIAQKRDAREQQESELAEVLAETEALQAQVSQQEMSVGDVQRLVVEKQAIDEELHRVTEAKMSLNSELQDAETGMKELLDEVDEATQQHQRRAVELKLVPASAKNAEGVDFSVRFNRHAKADDAWLDKDLKHEIKPRLGEVKARLVAKCHALQDDQYEAQEKQESLATKIQDHTDAIAQKEEECERAESALTSEKEVQEGKHRALMAEIDEIEARIHQLKTADESSLAKSQQRLEDLHTEYTGTAQKGQAEKQAMNEALLSLTFELTDHREYISKNLTMLTAKADEILKEVSLEEDVEASEAGGGMAS